MTSLGDAVERMVTGGRSSEPVSLRQSLQDLRDRYGSNRAAARELGVNESVFRRAINGQTASPGGGLRGAVERETRERNVKAGGLRDGDIRLTITDRAPGRGGRVRRDRDIGAANMRMAPGAGARIQGAYVAGGAEAGARQLLNEVKDPHYGKWLIPEDWEGSGDSGYGYSVG